MEHVNGAESNSKDTVWKSRKVLTLAFIQKDEDVLLGLKKRGFGQGLWNGFGGKVEQGEDIVSATAREIKEECGLEVNPKDLEQFGLIHFLFEGDPTVLEVHCFKTSTFSGEVVESDEMLPKWYKKTQVPHSQMWADDQVWYPLLLQGTSFQAVFLFRGYCQILAYLLKEFHFDTENTDDNSNVTKAKNSNSVLLQSESESYKLNKVWETVVSLPAIFPQKK